MYLMMGLLFTTNFWEVSCQHGSWACKPLCHPPPPHILSFNQRIHKSWTHVHKQSIRIKCVYNHTLIKKLRIPLFSDFCGKYQLLYYNLFLFNLFYLLSYDTKWSSLSLHKNLPSCIKCLYCFFSETIWLKYFDLLPNFQCLPLIRKLSNAYKQNGYEILVTQS